MIQRITVSTTLLTGGCIQTDTCSTPGSGSGNRPNRAKGYQNTHQSGGLKALHLKWLLGTELVPGNTDLGSAHGDGP